MKTILITGATSGIGTGIAETFARANYKVIINGRRQERLDKLSKDLENNFGAQVLSLCFDISDHDAVREAISGLPEGWRDIDILVNNAGLAQGKSTIDAGDVEDWDTMIDINVKGLLYVTRAVTPRMVERKKGHVINIGSIAGQITYREGNVYCATKFAAHSITDATRIDLLEHDIKVTLICPGAVETEFSLVRYKGDAERAKRVYQGYRALQAKDVAEAVYFVATRPSYVNINELTITPATQASVMYNKREKS